MPGKFCVSISHCRQAPEKATVGFVVANAALGSDKDTLVFLADDGVWAAVADEVATTEAGGPFAPLRDLIAKFLDNGGRIQACAPCLKFREVTEEMLVPGVQIAGGAALVEWISDGSPCISY